MSGEKRDTLLVMSVALAVTLAGIFGGVLFLGMEKARPGEGFHYTFDPARATLKASSYFAYLEKEGSPAAARAAGLARKLLSFLGPAPRAADAAAEARRSTDGVSPAIRHASIFSAPVPCARMVSATVPASGLRARQIGS